MVLTSVLASVSGNILLSVLGNVSPNILEYELECLKLGSFRYIET